MTVLGQRIERRDVVFLLLLASTLLVSWARLKLLLLLSLHYQEYQHYSHILLVLLVSATLLYVERKRVFSQAQWSPVAGAWPVAAGMAVFLASRALPSSWSMNDSLSLSLLGIVTTWLGAFILCYGFPALRAGIFPLLFLFLMVPIPDLVRQKIISWLVKGSAEVTAVLFQLMGVPVYRNGAVFALPGVTIEIAPECSGIRSSLAGFITALLAGHFFLRSNWSRAALVAAALPILVLKNGLRIVTLTLLAAYVDPGFLTGNLHKRGGTVFFALALLLLWPVLRLLEKTEKKAESGRWKKLAEARNLPADG